MVKTALCKGFDPFFSALNGAKVTNFTGFGLRDRISVQESSKLLFHLETR